MTYNPRGDVMPVIQNYIDPYLLKADNALRYLPRVFMDNVLRFNRIAYGDVSAQIRDDINKNKGRMSAILTSFFSDDTKNDMPVVIGYYVSDTAKHAILLLRKKRPDGSIEVEVFDPDDLTGGGVFRSSVDRLIRKNTVEKGWHLKVNNYMPLQRAGGVQCARLCWLRWYTYNNGFDDFPAATFKDLDSFYLFFKERVGLGENIEKAVIATMMSLGVEDKRMEAVLDIHVNNLGDTQALISEGMAREDELAHAHDKEIRRQYLTGEYSSAPIIDDAPPPSSLAPDISTTAVGAVSPYEEPLAMPPKPTERKKTAVAKGSGETLKKLATSPLLPAKKSARGGARAGAGAEDDG